MTQIAFVCTNYNNAHFTLQAVTSLQKARHGSDVQVVVVDNHSDEEDRMRLREIQRDHPDLAVIFAADNVGYFPGLNLGIRYVHHHYPEVRIVVVGNNDLVFPPEFVATLLRRQKVLDTWAVVAPDLVTLDGAHQNPHVVRPISRARRMVWDLYFSAYPIGLLLQNVAVLTRRFTARDENRPDSTLHRTPGPVEQGYGACYVLGPLFFRHFSGLCAPTFLMQEEFFLNEQLRYIHQQVYYDPELIVTHHTHATMGKIQGRTRWMISRASHRIYKRYLAMTQTERRECIAAWSRNTP